MSITNRLASRRSALCGLLGGAAVTVALPLLDCFLDGNGVALAATKAPLPVRFGTWFWGLGHSPGFAISSKTGPDYEFLEECEALKPWKQQISFFSGFRTLTDGAPNIAHFSGLWPMRTGSATADFGDIPSTTLDVLVSDAIGTSSRFRSLQLSATTKDSYSARGKGNVNASEPSPVALYQRVFGPEFVDPNNATFKPDPRVMLRKSVLSAVKDESAHFVRDLGSADKQRMDQYFTSIRELEHQLDLELQPPPPMEACRRIVPPRETEVGTEVGEAIANHKVMSQLLAMTLACNQTRVFNMLFSVGTSPIRRPGESATHHTLTHEEPVDAKLGYQPNVSWLNRRSMEALADFIAALAAIREGDGTLLDNTLVFAHSESGYARVHSLDDIPVMFIGRAGGKIRPGLHVQKAYPVTSLGLTAMQVMGLPIGEWGTKSLRTAQVVSDVMV